MKIGEEGKAAVIYARVSTARQAEEELPLDSQVARCKERAAALGARVVKQFVDPGLSGRSDRRPKFRAAIEYCEGAGVDYFITWSTSRFARNKVDAGVYKLRLARAGTELVYASMRLDRESDAGWMTEGVLELFDEFVSRQVAQDTIRSMAANAERGYWNGGNPPLGYRPIPAPDNPARRRLEVNEAEAGLVREIFRKRLEGVGTKAIAQWLNERGMLHRGRPWKNGAVARLLRNEAVIGRVVFGRKDRSTGRRRPREDCIAVDAHQPIIDAETWQAVQSMMDAGVNPTERGHPTSTHLFTGMLRCGLCGARMQVETAKGRSKRYSYYGCRARQREGTCRMGRIPCHELDEFLVGVIGEKVFTRANLDQTIRDLHEAAGAWSRDHAARAAALEREIEKVEQRNSKLFELLERHGAETPHLGDVTRRLRANNKELQALETQLGDLREEEPPEIAVTEDDVDELRELLMEIIRTTDRPATVREFFSHFIRQIVVDEEDVSIRYNPDLLVAVPAGTVHRRVHSGGIWLPGRTLLRTRTVRVPRPARRGRAAPDARRTA